MPSVARHKLQVKNMACDGFYIKAWFPNNDWWFFARVLTKHGSVGSHSWGSCTRMVKFYL